MCQPGSRKYFVFLQLWQINEKAKAEEEIQQHVREKISKSTDKATHNCGENVERFLQRTNFGQKLSRYKQHRPRKVTLLYNLLYL